MSKNHWRIATSVVGASAFLVMAVSPAAVAAPGGGQGDENRASVSRTSDSHQVVRYGEHPGGNFTFKANARFEGDSGYSEHDTIASRSDGEVVNHSRITNGS